MPDLWKKVREAQHEKVETRERNIASLQEAIRQFNHMAQDAYDDAISAQHKYIVGAIGKKMAKMTLTEVINSAIGTWGIGTGVGYITENEIGGAFISEAIGQGVGVLYDFADEKISDKVSELLKTPMDRDAKAYLENAITQSQIPTAGVALQQFTPLTVYPGLSPLVAHSVKSREADGLIKEVAHQVDQTARALNDLESVITSPDNRPATGVGNKPIFRKCRVATEVFCAVYWFGRKLRKLVHFLGFLKADYAKTGAKLAEMENFWRANARAMEEAAFSQSLRYRSKNPLKKTGDREHLLTEVESRDNPLVKKQETTGHITKGERNWRESRNRR